MEEIKVGEYIRTRKGLIRKVETIKSGKRQFTRTTETLVNGQRVFATDNRINDNGEKVILTENYDEWTDNGVVSNKDIKSIVTKEMIKSVEYRIN